MRVSNYIMTAVKVLLIVLIFPIAYILQEIAKFTLKVAQDGGKFLNYIVDEW